MTAATFTDHERKVLASDDRMLDRMFARRHQRWFVPRPPPAIHTCPHGVAVTIACRSCPIGGAA